MRLILLFLLLALSPLAPGAEADLLEPDKAIRFQARVRDERSIEIRYQIAPGYYLYREKFKFTLAPEAAKLGVAQMPAGKKHKDEFFGEVETYRGPLVIVLPFEPAGELPPVVTLKALSQGCADAGVCYVPHEQKAELKLAAAGGSAPRADVPASPAGGAQSGDDASFAAVLGGGFWLAIVSFFGFGLLLSFTPCVLPMV